MIGGTLESIGRAGGAVRALSRGAARSIGSFGKAIGKRLGFALKAGGRLEFPRIGKALASGKKRLGQLVDDLPKHFKEMGQVLARVKLPFLELVWRFNPTKVIARFRLFRSFAGAVTARGGAVVDVFAARVGRNVDEVEALVKAADQLSPRDQQRLFDILQDPSRSNADDIFEDLQKRAVSRGARGDQTEFAEGAEEAVSRSTGIARNLPDEAQQIIRGSGPGGVRVPDLKILDLFASVEVS